MLIYELLISYKARATEPVLLMDLHSKKAPTTTKLPNSFFIISFRGLFE